MRSAYAAGCDSFRLLSHLVQIFSNTLNPAAERAERHVGEQPGTVRIED
jgi:hypothetical protein